MLSFTFYSWYPSHKIFAAFIQCILILNAPQAEEYVYVLVVIDYSFTGIHLLTYLFD